MEGEYSTFAGSLSTFDKANKKNVSFHFGKCSTDFGLVQ